VRPRVEFALEDVSQTRLRMRPKKKLQHPKRQISVAANQFGSELEDEYRRMCNEWFFQWHHVNSQKGTRVDDFNGRQISYTNVAFSGSAEIVYWAALDRYLRQKIAGSFVRIAKIVAEEHADPSYELGWLTSKVKELTARVSHKASETYYLLKQQRMVTPLARDAGRLLVHSHAEIDRLRDSVETRLISTRHYGRRIWKSIIEPDFVTKLLLVIVAAMLAAVLGRVIGS
jgi:hypothetical protein